MKFVSVNETPDGSRTVFTAQSAYVAGTLRVLLDGRLLDDALDNGFVEGTPPAFTMKVAPRTGSTLWTFYRGT